MLYNSLGENASYICMHIYENLGGKDKCCVGNVRN